MTSSKMNMKSLTLITLLAAAATTFAQEESPTPDEELSLRGGDALLRSEPSVSVPSESTTPDYPAPGKPLVTPKPKFTPAETAEAEATATPRATATAKRGATPAPSPRASATPAVPASKKNAQATLKELENKWAAATSTHDVEAVQALLAGDYMGVTAGGNQVNKAGLLAELRKDKNTYESVVNSGLNVRVHGATAVVVGTTKQRGKDAAGKEFSYTYRWTDTWLERAGQWQCIASQSIRLQR